MKSKDLFTTSLIILSCLLMIENTEPVSVHVLFWRLTMSRIILIVFCLMVGCIIGYRIAKSK